MIKWNTYQREVRTQKTQLCHSCLTRRDSGTRSRNRTECFYWDKCQSLLLQGPGTYHNSKDIPNYAQVREICLLFLPPVQLQGQCGSWKKCHFPKCPAAPQFCPSGSTEHNHSTSSGGEDGRMAMTHPGLADYVTKSLRQLSYLRLFSTPPYLPKRTLFISVITIQLIVIFISLFICLYLQYINYIKAENTSVVFNFRFPSPYLALAWYQIKI